jgi:hypothetical protein
MNLNEDQIFLWCSLWLGETSPSPGQGNKKKHTLYLAVAHQEVTTAPLGLEIDWQRQDKLIWK